MYAEERQQAMAEIVALRGRMSVVELAKEFDVTTETVRRDLSALERLHLLRRVHGGALPIDTFTVIEAGLTDRDSANIEKKIRIAQAAIALLPSAESTLLVDAGTTTVRFADALPRENRWTVFTHSVPVASRLASLAHIDLHLLPGRVRRTTQAAVGPETVEALASIRADIAFMGTNGVSASHGLSTPDHAEAATKRAFVRCAQRVIVLADSSKIGMERTLRFAALEEIDVLVTDEEAPREQIRLFEAANVEVVIA